MKGSEKVHKTQFATSHNETWTEYFQIKFVNPQENSPQQQHIENLVDLFEQLDPLPVYQYFLTSPKKIGEVIKYLKNRRAPRPDDISNILLKNLSRKSIVQLYHIINAIFRLQHYSSTITILKAGKPANKSIFIAPYLCKTQFRKLQTQ